MINEGKLGSMVELMNGPRLCYNALYQRRLWGNVRTGNFDGNTAESLDTGLNDLMSM